MYLKHLYCENQGPISKINLEMKFKDNLPVPYIIVGQNGSGKSILLSNIVDAFYEIGALKYHNVKPLDEFGRAAYFKIISSNQIQINKEYSVAIADFFQNENKFRYLFKVGTVSFDEFRAVNKLDLSEEFRWNEYNFKKAVCKEDIVQYAFEEDIICYFSPMRYNKPFWQVDSHYRNCVNKFEKKNLIGELRNDIHANIDYNMLLQWIFDVIADSRADLKKKSYEPGYEILYPSTTIIDKLSITRHNLEAIMSAILGRKVSFRMGNRSAVGRRFSILDSDNNILLYSLDALSTGQLALFELFATIIMYADRDNIDLSYKLNEISGIVVIDEIELHLHPSLQAEILPKLIKLFPRIQFILTSHSPLFVLGMKKEFGNEGMVVYEMPYGEEIEAEAFSEFENAYKYYTNTDKYIKELEKVISQNSNDKALIITEGRTDYMHMEAAFRELSSMEEYKEIFEELDFEFLKYDKEMNAGNQVICSMCENFSKVPLQRKMIFIADRDEPSVNKKLMENGKTYKKWSEQVYSFILPIPQHREKTPNIAIEHLYSDDVIKTEFAIGEDNMLCRLYMGNEFDERGISLDGDKICEKRKICGPGRINIIDGSSGERVTLIKNKNDNIALSKMQFAKKILDGCVHNIDFTAFVPIFATIRDIIKK